MDPVHAGNDCFRNSSYSGLSAILCGFWGGVTDVGWAVQGSCASQSSVALLDQESKQACAVSLRTLSWAARPWKRSWMILTQVLSLCPRQSASSARRQAILSLTLCPARPPAERTPPKS